MNYRHAFHAGNFADIVKHAALLALLRTMTAGPPLSVIDTHAGAGIYDLSGEAARRSGEAQAGILRLMTDPNAPPALEPLKAAVKALNQGGETRLYPGSPWLAARGLRKGDHYVGCELRADDNALLAGTLAPFANATALNTDGYRALLERAGRGPLLALIDPPFERADDYERSAQAISAMRARNPLAVVAVWLPLKDLETFDAFLRRLGEAALVAEVRLRPLTDPMKMNGCALVITGASAELARTLAPVCEWAAGANGSGRVWTLTP